jgi:DNA mismatch endonuclease (patch repair protein)
MRNIKSTGMKPEMLVRRLVHGMGYRYRLHKHKLPGRPDLVFAPRKKVIFVHGCFWHSHNDPNCPISHKPRSNLEYWLPKLERTRARDRENIKALNELGWSTLEIWECELRSLDSVQDRIFNFLN